MPAVASKMLALPCGLTVSEVSRISFRTIRVVEDFFQRAAHYYRGPRSFDVTLVVWDENAWKKCFQGGLAVA